MNEVFLPYKKLCDGDMPFHWLCYHRAEEKLKGNFSHIDTLTGSYIFFDEKEDMEYFILMWGEYL